MRHPTEAEAAAAIAAAPRGVWLGLAAGARTSVPYPCLCSTRPAWARECSAAWCPCSGRPDPQGVGCCGWRYGPAEHKAAMEAWRIKKLQEAEDPDE